MLALGTANWGASYGAPGREAQVDDGTASALADRFLAAGHCLVDTATAYGRSEDVVGRAFVRGGHRVVTKIAASGLPDDPVEAHVVVQEALGSSARRTGVRRLAGVLLHDSDVALQRPLVTRKLLEGLRASGLVERAGVSVYSPEEAVVAVESLGANLVQLPCSLLDQRCVGTIARLRGAGAEVHVRSIFLNGVLLTDARQLRPPTDDLAHDVARIHHAAAVRDSTPLRLAVAFARHELGADAVVVGAYELTQLEEILNAWAAEPPRSLDWASFASDAPAVDPRMWRR
jgi:aryl-alcohol dehydrogenase-like predicted oxidoreductase